MLATSVTEAAVYESLKKKNPKFTEAELNAKAKEFARNAAQKQNKYILASLNKTYGQLSKEELASYLTHLQRHNAKRATKLQMQATSNVLKKFIGGYFRRL
jgi:16S rRNA A1518/A1519 N6-dimethyltransferase RsmA/KsgA/DIM1 with predicted DNA glycosylase/AP lyase activity